MQDILRMPIGEPEGSVVAASGLFWRQEPTGRLPPESDQLPPKIRAELAEKKRKDEEERRRAGDAAWKKWVLEQVAKEQKQNANIQDATVSAEQKKKDEEEKKKMGDLAWRNWVDETNRRLRKQAGNQTKVGDDSEVREQQKQTKEADDSFRQWEARKRKEIRRRKRDEKRELKEIERKLRLFQKERRKHLPKEPTASLPNINKQTTASSPTGGGEGCILRSNKGKKSSNAVSIRKTLQQALAEVEGSPYNVRPSADYTQIHLKNNHNIGLGKRETKPSEIVKSDSTPSSSSSSAQTTTTTTLMAHKMSANPAQSHKRTEPVARRSLRVKKKNRASARKAQPKARASHHRSGVVQDPFAGEAPLPKIFESILGGLRDEGTSGRRPYVNTSQSEGSLQNLKRNQSEEEGAPGHNNQSQNDCAASESDAYSNNSYDDEDDDFDHLSQASASLENCTIAGKGDTRSLPLSSHGANLGSPNENGGLSVAYSDSFDDTDIESKDGGVGRSTHLDSEGDDGGQEYSGSFDDD